jgi:hypothetical protein
MKLAASSDAGRDVVGPTRDEAVERLQRPRRDAAGERELWIASGAGRAEQANGERGRLGGRHDRLRLLRAWTT